MVVQIRPGESRTFSGGKIEYRRAGGDWSWEESDDLEPLKDLMQLLYGKVAEDGASWEIEPDRVVVRSSSTWLDYIGEDGDRVRETRVRIVHFRLVPKRGTGPSVHVLSQSSFMILLPCILHPVNSTVYAYALSVLSEAGIFSTMSIRQCVPSPGPAPYEHPGPR